MERASTEHPLFLRWALINALLFIFLTTAGGVYHSHLTGATLVALPLILSIYLGATAFAGKLTWRTDVWIAEKDDALRDYRLDKRRSRVRHDCEWLSRWAYTCQIAGIMCTMGGFFVILSQSGAQADLTSKLAGGSVALLGSFVGVLCSLVLLLQSWLIEHALED